ncbi:hypothetical protein GOV09_05335 [Candidatus Woesearchaeota archaeon]|nr:hypothetical protein [Candidatus Woesearchaeota archaeon]
MMGNMEKKLREKLRKKIKWQYEQYKSVGKIPHPLSHIRFKGVWDMQDLYEFVANFLRERKYKFHEKIYKHKHPSPYGVEQQLVWEANQVVDDVYTYVINFYVHTYDAQDIQVKMKDGSVRTFTKGRVWIEITSHIDMYEHIGFGKNAFLAYLKIVMQSYLLRKRHGWIEWDVMMYREVQKLIWLMRRRLKMEYDEYEQKDWMGVHT